MEYQGKHIADNYKKKEYLSKELDPITITGYYNEFNLGELRDKLNELAKKYDLDNLEVEVDITDGSWGSDYEEDHSAYLEICFFTYRDETDEEKTDRIERAKKRIDEEIREEKEKIKSEREKIKNHIKRLQNEIKRLENSIEGEEI